MFGEPPIPQTAEYPIVEGYLVVSTASLWTWDVIIGLSEDVRMFSGRKLKLSDLMYILARIATGGFLVTPTAITVMNHTSCNAVMRGVAWFEAFALICNSSLFLFRVLAVFAQSLPMKIIFCLLWLTTFSALAIPSSSAFIHLVPGCDLVQVKPVATACFILVAIFDNLVFLAISIRLTILNAGFLKGLSFTTFFRGKGLGHVTKTVLRTGQFYYAVTMVAHLLALIVLLSPENTFSPPYQAGFTLMSMSLQNIMGCRVFRLLRLGVIDSELMTSVEDLSIRFAPANMKSGCATESFLSSVASPISKMDPQPC